MCRSLRPKGSILVCQAEKKLGLGQNIFFFLLGYDLYKFGDLEGSETVTITLDQN